MFVDASAIVAILTREPEADALADVLENSRAAITSPIAIFEAVLGICRNRHASVEEFEHDVGEFLEAAGVRTAPITDKEAHTALAAFSRYGNGRGHPAQLNLGDCLRMQWQRTVGQYCCLKAKISTRPTSAPLCGRANNPEDAAKAMRAMVASRAEAANLIAPSVSRSSRASRRSTAAPGPRRSSCCCRSGSIYGRSAAATHNATPSIEP